MRRCGASAMTDMADPPPLASKSEQDIRTKLAQLRARYDFGALPPSVFSVIRKLEIEIAWLEHRGRQ
jgi:hypothetical protein